MNCNDTNRKRKRKTRSERNQQSHHFTQDQQEKDNVVELSKETKQRLCIKKDQEKDNVDDLNNEIKQKCGNRKKHLRSRKAVGEIPKVKEYKKQTAATITQSRLTVKPAKRQGIPLTKSKSSDWVKRGPPESDAMKKKVDLDLKDMLEIAEQLNQKECNETETELEVNIVTSPEQEPAAVHKEDNSSTRDNLDIAPTKVIPAATISPCEIQASTPSENEKQAARDSGFSDTPTNCSTLDGNIADPTFVRTVSDTMLKEPQCCCLKIFEKRDMGNELRRDVLDLWEERKRIESFAGHDISDIYSTSKHYLPFEEYNTPSALSSCRAFPLKRNRNSGDVIMQANQDDNHSSIFGTPIDLTNDVETSIFLPATSDHDISAQCMEPHFGFCLKQELEEMDTDQEEDDDVAVQFFIDSARKLEAEQAALAQMKKEQHYRNSQRSKSDFRSYGKRSSNIFGDDISVLDDQKFDWDSILQPDLPTQLSFGQMPISSGRKMHSASKPSRRNESRMYQINEDDDFQDRFNSQSRQSLPFEDFQHFNSMPMSSRHLESNQSNDVYGLSMSRHKLHKSLQKACEETKSKYNHDDSGFFSILNPDVSSRNDMDSIFGMDTSHDPWGFTDLSSHQADLQQQAHDFLSHHGGSRGSKSSKVFPSRSQICETASPDSNGSPVWSLASSVLKDIQL